MGIVVLSGLVFGLVVGLVVGLRVSVHDDVRGCWGPGMRGWLRMGLVACAWGRWCGGREWVQDWVDEPDFEF